MILQWSQVVKKHSILCPKCLMNASSEVFTLSFGTSYLNNSLGGLDQCWHKESVWAKCFSSSHEQGIWCSLTSMGWCVSFITILMAVILRVRSPATPAATHRIVGVWRTLAPAWAGTREVFFYLWHLGKMATQDRVWWGQQILCF